MPWRCCRWPARRRWPGFFGEFTVGAALAQSGHFELLALGLLGSLMGMVAALGTLRVLYLQNPLDEARRGGVALPVWTRLSRGGAVALCVVIAAYGLFANPILALADQGAEGAGSEVVLGDVPRGAMRRPPREWELTDTYVDSRSPVAPRVAANVLEVAFEDTAGRPQPARARRAASHQARTRRSRQRAGRAHRVGRAPG